LFCHVIRKGKIVPATNSPLADAVIEGWEDYQKQLVVVTQPLSAEELAIRIAPNLRTVGEIIAHIIAGRAFWLHKVLKERDDEIAPLMQWDDEGQPVRTAAELASGLEMTWNLIQNALAHWTSEELAEPIVLPWIGPKYPITRSFVIWHLIEHDLHHGGEVTHSLGMEGMLVKLPPPPPER
jgi:uncharacterized damage-inducible protein DinB